MPLSADQLQAIRVLDWLRQALRNPGMRIPFMDHAGESNGCRILAAVQGLVASHPTLRDLPWRFHDRYLILPVEASAEWTASYTGRLGNWLPELEGITKIVDLNLTAWDRIMRDE